MADDVIFQSATPATPPAGTKVSADEDSSSALIQRVKLAFSADGSRTHVQADADGVLVNLGANNDVTVSGSVNATLQAGDNVAGRVKITDGTDVADVLSLSNSKPLVVAVVDGSGDQVTSFGGGSGGTQYTEDNAAVANPVGTALNLIRDDARAGSLTTTDGDNVSARGTNAGELYVKHVDAIPVTDNGGTLTVDGTVGVTHAALTELAAAIDTEVQVDIVGALPAGNNNIGDVDVASLPSLPSGTNNIGDVDVLSVVPGTGATNLGKAEDAAHTTGDVGVMALAVRQSSQADFGADGDYVPLSIDDDGGLRVSIVAGAGSGGTAAADDADFSAGSTSGTPAMGVFESSPTSVTDGDLGVVGITSGRRLKTSATIDAALPAGTNNIGDVDVLTLPALPAGNNNIGDVDVASLPALPAGNNNIGDVDVASVPADPFGVNADAASATGSISAKLRFIASTGIPVTGSVAVTNAGTFAVQESGAALTALQLIDNAVSGAGFNITQFAGTNAVVGSGTATGALRVELPTNGTGVIATVGAVTAITNALPAGTNAIGKLAANSGVDIGDVDITSIAAGANVIGKVGIDQTTPGTTNAVSATNFPATVDTNDGNSGASTLRVVIATDQPKLTTTSNYPTRQFFGTLQTVINSAVDIAAGNFSGAPSATYDNTTDAAYPYARYACAMLEAPDWAAAPVAGTAVDLYGVILNVDGTDDETDAPSGTSAGGAHYFGSWYIAAADALQRRQIVIDLLGIEQVDFYIKNGTAQNMNNDGGTSCVVKIRPLALGVVA